jgi:hypothetical protein
MTGLIGAGGRRGGSRSRKAVWGAAALILLLPLAAMRITGEMRWDAADFVVLGLMLGLACGGYELAARASESRAYRAGAGVALAGAFLLVWVNLAVGIIGHEDNPANLMFGGVLGVAILGTALARLRPAGMARALAATAVAQVSVGAVVLGAGLGADAPSFPGAIVVLTGFFAAVWLFSARLFRKARREQARRDALP